MSTHSQNTVLVWDPFVRIFHWTLVLSFFTAYVTEDEVLGLHLWSGYLALALVLLRVVWGFVGTPYARFQSFVYGPGAILEYLGQVIRFRAPRYLGHNPAGGVMILALLLTITVLGLSGLVLYGAETGTGTLGALAANLGVGNEAGEHLVEEIHEFLADLVVFLVVIHVAGVLFESFVHRENLVRALFTGRKPKEP